MSPDSASRGAVSGSGGDVGTGSGRRFGERKKHPEHSPSVLLFFSRIRKSLEHEKKFLNPLILNRSVHLISKMRILAKRKAATSLRKKHQSCKFEDAGLIDPSGQGAEKESPETLEARAKLVAGSESHEFGGENAEQELIPPRDAPASASPDL
ncbi:unnamed protein product [Amoebophrya sp. A120]|nr:unnamed protein product [Amoebophrya sp. A120]|eukprot:GSA120T00015428001.1